jgi:hypothetical protein
MTSKLSPIKIMGLVIMSDYERGMDHFLYVSLSSESTSIVLDVIPDCQPPNTRMDSSGS